MREENCQRSNSEGLTVVQLYAVLYQRHGVSREFKLHPSCESASNMLAQLVHHQVGPVLIKVWQTNSSPDNSQGRTRTPLKIWLSKGCFN